MAYNGRPGGYQEAQYQTRPQDQARNHGGYENRQYDRAHAPYPTQNRQSYDRYQQDVYANNQQFSHSHNYDPAWEPDRNGGQHYDNQAGQQYTDEREQQSPRQYQYDERFRTRTNGVAPHNAGRGNGPAGRRSPIASRPGTSASSRAPKQERILETAKFDTPKAMAWDNPFGVFPGTKKDIEKKKKDSDEARSRSRAGTSPEGPVTSRRSQESPPNQERVSRTTTRTFPEERRSRTSTGRRPQSPRGNPGYFDQPSGPIHDMPLRKKTPSAQEEQPMPRAQQYPGFAPTSTQSMPVRPAPHRSTTEPPSSHVPYSNGAEPLPQQARPIPQQRQIYDTNVDIHRETMPGRSDYSTPSYGYDNRDPRADPHGLHHPYADSLNSHSVPKGNFREPNGQQQWKNSTNGDPRDLSYRGVELTRPITNTIETSTPNFGAMAPGATEHVEKEVTLQAMQPAYRKPTYEDVPSKPAPVRPDLMQQVSPRDYAQSPIGGFDFGLPPPDTVPDPPLHPGQPRETSNNYGIRTERQLPPSSTRDDRMNEPSHQQHQTNNGGHTNTNVVGPAPGFFHPYNKPPINNAQHSPTQQGTSSPVYGDQRRGQPPPQGTLGFDSSRNNRGIPQSYSQSHYHRDKTYSADPSQEDAYEPKQPLARTHTEPVNQGGLSRYHDNYNHGYNQRDLIGRPQDSGPLQVQRQGDPYQARGPPQQYSQRPPFDERGHTTPARPRTANSARTPVGQYPEGHMPGSQPFNSVFPASDRNHPPPVRPGLMSTSPETTTPVSMPAPAPQKLPPQTGIISRPNQPVNPPDKTPVTTQELNNLRNACQNQPQDSTLGLKFAKRLVEASSVLANEGGRADAKQTAKNRERYINDAHKVVKKLVATGSTDAMFYLADCYGQGLLGLEVNPKEAFQLYTSAAKLGHAQAAFRVAVCCELGQESGGGTRRDHLKAVQFYKRAATLGDGPAMFKIGIILLKGLLGQPANRREGISWLKRAAERADEENPHALHELAVLYEGAQSTDVIIRDERYALQLFTQAANLGYKFSQQRLGSAFEYGTLGVPIDPRESITWYSKAAQQGEHQAEFALSGWYLTGSENLLAQNDQEAYLWARKAAQSGLAKAEYAMGYYTEVGIGCPPNLEEAKKWYFRAAAQLDNRAKERLEEIKRGGARKEKTRVSRSHVGRQNEGECTVM